MKKYKPIHYTMAYGTHFQTCVEASYKQLVELFGEPNAPGDDYKVSTQWVLKDKKERIVTLYDYKETNLYEQNLPSVKRFRHRKKYQWHIGAFHLKEAEELQRFIEKNIAGKMKTKNN